MEAVFTSKPMNEWIKESKSKPTITLKQITEFLKTCGLEEIGLNKKDFERLKKDIIVKDIDNNSFKYNSVTITTIK